MGRTMEEGGSGWAGLRAGNIAAEKATRAKAMNPDGDTCTQPPGLRLVWLEDSKGQRLDLRPEGQVRR